MKKKYIVAIIVAVVLAGAYFTLSDRRRKTDDHVFFDQAGGRLVEIANKNARAGMAQMGRALNQYRQDMGVYPDALMDLYPNYINMKDFITEVDWRYQKETDNFLLTKTILSGTTRQTASIDKSLRPHTGESIMVAAIEDTVTQAFSSRKEPGAQEVVLARDVLRPQFVADEERHRVLDGQTGPVIERPEIVTVRRGEIREGMGADIARNYMVWRDDQGHLGFGNLAYPDRDRLNAYADGSWFEISIPETHDMRSPAEFPRTASAMRDREDIAAHFSQHILVWKDAEGTLGFGNQSFPDQQADRIFDRGRWMEMEKPALRAESSPTPPPRSPDQIAADLSRGMTVWKDARGHLGFGDTMIPHDAGASRVFLNNQWLARPTPADESTGIPTGAQRSLPERLSPADIAARQSSHFVVWKDSKGRLGFGNTLQPRKDGEIHIHVNNSWEKIESPPRTAAPTTTSSASLRFEQPAFEDKVKALCEYMLVWKDRNGVIGFGNLDFPVRDETEHICVNGVWRKAAN